MKTLLELSFPTLRAFRVASPKDQRDLICLCLAILICVVYLPVIQFDFVSYDDPIYIYQNPHVRSGISVDGIYWALTTLHGNVSYWHPLTWLSHQLDFQLFHFISGAHHLTSVLLHAANTCWVFLIVRRMSGGNVLAGFTLALLFGLHPLRVESVAWIAERKDVLCAFFYLAGIHFYFRYAERPGFRRYTTVLICFALALMSKPMAVTFPCVLLLLDVWPLRRFSFDIRQQLIDRPGSGAEPIGYPFKWRSGLSWCRDNFFRGAPFRVIGEKLPFLIASGVGSLFAIRAQEDLGAIMPSDVLPLGERLANAVVSCVLYIYKFLLPINLSVHYSHPIEQPLWLIAFSAVSMAIIAALALRLRCHRPMVLVGCLWFLGTLLPTIGLVQAGSQSMADRYTYIPSVGLLFVVVGFIPDLIVLLKPALFSGIIMGLSCLAFLTERQLSFWQDSPALFGHAINVDPGDYIMHNNLGSACLGRGLLDLAQGEFQAAISLRPYSTLPNVNMASLLIREGKSRDALPFLFHAWHHAEDKDKSLVEQGLGEAYLHLGKTGEALIHYRQALANKPDFIQPKIRLAEILATSSEAQIRDGRRALKLALELCAETLDSDPGILNILATAYAEVGLFNKAAKTAEKAATIARSKGDSILQKQIQKRLDLYYRHQAYHGGPFDDIPEDRNPRSSRARRSGALVKEGGNSMLESPRAEKRRGGLHNSRPTAAALDITNAPAADATRQAMHIYE